MYSHPIRFNQYVRQVFTSCDDVLRKKQFCYILARHGDRNSLSQEVLNFESTLNQYRRMMNATTLSQSLAKSIAVVVSGSNDYISNYLLSALYSSSYNYNAQEFGNLLFNSYVRKILVFEC